jgi:hypothetical protein
MPQPQPDTQDGNKHKNNRGDRGGTYRGHGKGRGRYQGWYGGGNRGSNGGRKHYNNKGEEAIKVGMQSIIKIKRDTLKEGIIPRILRTTKIIIVVVAGAETAISNLIINYFQCLKM